MTAPPTVLLFDIDGTLVSTGGAGRRAMSAAFVELGGYDPCDFHFGGMTDRAIAREGLKRAGRDSTEAAIDSLLQRYLALLEIEAAAGRGFRILAGILAALDTAERVEDVALGLGTGNIRRGAELKLTPVGLYHRFHFGGFGCDHEERAELLRAGAHRGADRLGRSIDRCRVVVIGDTPRDVVAALAIGAECVAVGTGGVEPEVLRAEGATYAFPDLSVAGALEALLGPAAREPRRERTAG